MNVKTLKDSPHKKEECIQLIENSFNYNDDHSYESDFALLFEERNASYCYFIEEDDLVVATLFCLPRTLNYKDNQIKALFLGGISVRDENRGAGLFRSLLETILLFNSDFSVYFLWSDLANLYEKFNFYEFGLIASEQGHTEASETKKDENALTKIKASYGQIKEKYLIPDRDEATWNTFTKQDSIKLFSNNDSYYFVGKGMDLKDICHEKHPLNARGITGYKNWNPDIERSDLDKELSYMGFVRLGNLEELSKLIKKTSGSRLEILGREQEKIKVLFDGEEYQLNDRDFIQGLWGPGKVEEWVGLVPDIIIFGFDSI